MSKYLLRLKAIESRKRLFVIVDELARLEHWPREHCDFIAWMIERQPASAIASDEAYFLEQLDRARAASATGRPR
jgi:hypothetical protein